MASEVRSSMHGRIERVEDTTRVSVWMHPPTSKRGGCHTYTVQRGSIVLFGPCTDIRDANRFCDQYMRPSDVTPMADLLMPVDDGASQIALGL